jgi:hypothetical protein
MISNWKLSAIVAIGCLLLCPLAMMAQQKGTALAKSELQLGEDARLTGDFEAAVRHSRAAIDAAPDMIEAHEQFTMAMYMAEDNKLRKNAEQRGDPTTASSLARKRVAELYQQWAAKHPGKIIYRYFAVSFGHPMGDLAAEVEYKRMVQTNPTFAPPYGDLANFAAMKGDDAGRREYLRKMAELQPENANYQARYVGTFLYSDPAEYLKLADDFVQRFPHESGTFAVLVWAAERAPHPSGKNRLPPARPRRRPYRAAVLCPDFALCRIRNDRPR